MHSVILDSGAQGTSRRLERLFPVLLMWGKLGVSAQNLNLPTSVSRPASIKALAANDQVKNKQGFPKHTIEHLFSRNRRLPARYQSGKVYNAAVEEDDDEEEDLDQEEEEGHPFCFPHLRLYLFRAGKLVIYFCVFVVEISY